MSSEIESGQGAGFGTQDALDTRYQGKRLPTAHLQPIHGLSLWLTLACLSMGLLLSALETTIIATALVSIASSLGGFDKSNWVVTAYLITYTAFLVVWARVSDLLGRKSTLIASLITFTAFSLACGLSQTIEQLIVFRAFQGLGGAGLYSLAMTVMAEVTPAKYIGVAVGLMSAIFATSSILGTLLGGVIASQTTWRWVFLLNLPPGAVCLIVVIFVFPVNPVPLPLTWRMLEGIDFLGIAAFLIGCIPFIFALESGGIHYTWNSPVIIATLTIGGVGAASFMLWQWYVSRRPVNKNFLPLFPARLVSQRTLGLIMLSSFFAGFPFMSIIIFLPQRLQVQNGLSPLQAGIAMLALLLLSATGSALGGVLSAHSKVNGMSWYVLVGGISLQMIGLGLLTTLPESGGPVPRQQYAFQALLGLGFGITISGQAIAARLEVDQRDISVIMSAVTQLRVLGGLIGITIGQAIISTRLAAQVGPVLGPERLAQIRQSIEAIKDFPPELANIVKRSYGQSFLLLFRVMVGFAAVALIACLAAWKPDFDNVQNAEERRAKGLQQEMAASQSQTKSGEGINLPPLVHGHQSRGHEHDGPHRQQ